MRRLLMLTILAAIAVGCRSTAPQQPCCRPAYVNPCNPCGGAPSYGAPTYGAPMMSGPAMGSPMVETYATPTLQSGPTVVTPDPQSYAPTTN
jgi:hypothetical protein